MRHGQPLLRNRRGVRLRRPEQRGAIVETIAPKAGPLEIGDRGILYLTFEDIAPAAAPTNRWSPPLGAVAGFLFGLLGEMLFRG